MTEKLLLEGENNEEDWDFVSMQFQEAIDKIAEKSDNPYVWDATSINFGWRSLNGTAHFEVRNAGDLLLKILPETECHFLIYVDYETSIIRIQNYHHDSPTGNEWYTIQPAKRETEEEE
jgi:hypothetical protein